MSRRGREKLHTHAVPRLPMDQSRRLTSLATIVSENIFTTFLVILQGSYVMCSVRVADQIP